jgi:hypothetical protein
MPRLSDPRRLARRNHHQEGPGSCSSRHSDARAWAVPATSRRSSSGWSSPSGCSRTGTRVGGRRRLPPSSDPPWSCSGAGWPSPAGVRRGGTDHLRRRGLQQGDALSLAGTLAAGRLGRPTAALAMRAVAVGEPVDLGMGQGQISRRRRPSLARQPGPRYERAAPKRAVAHRPGKGPFLLWRRAAPRQLPLRRPDRRSQPLPCCPAAPLPRCPAAPFPRAAPLPRCLLASRPAARARRCPSWSRSARRSRCAACRSS